MSAAVQQPPNLGDILTDVWQAKMFLVLGALVGLAVAIAFTVAAVPHYKSQMMVGPASSMNGAESSSLLADDNLFALRYVMQRMGANSSSDFMRFENTYDGASVAEVLLQDPKIVDGLKLDHSFSFSETKDNWTAAELSEYISKRVRLEPVGASAMRRMVYLHPRSDFGQYFLQSLHSATDGLIRRTVRQDAGEHITHLQASIRETKNPDHRRALTSLLMEQERLRMLASVGTPYAASVVEPPSSGAKVAWPGAALVFAGFMAVGVLLGFMVHAGVHGSRQGRGAHVPVSAKRWFKRDSGNTNHPLTGAQSENHRDVA